MNETSLRSRQGPFPVMNIVIALVLLVLAFASLDLADRAGVEMTSHGTSTTGWVVQQSTLVLMLVAVALELVAIIRAAICLVKYPVSRKLLNGFLLSFSIMVFSGFAIFAFGLHR